MSTTRIRLAASFGTTASPLLGRSRRVAEYRATTSSSEPALAVSANGEVAVAWFELDSGPAPPRFVGQRYRLRIAVTRACLRFRPRTLGRFLFPIRDAEPVAPAYGRRGELLVAYGAARLVVSQVRPFLAARSGAPRAAVRAPAAHRTAQGGMDLQAAALPSGRMILAWGSKDAGEGSERPRVIRAALRAPGGRFGAATVLDPGEHGTRRAAPDRAGDGARRVGHGRLGQRPGVLSQPAVPGSHRDRAAGNRLRARDHARRQRSTRLGQRLTRWPDACDLDHRHLRLHGPRRTSRPTPSRPSARQAPPRSVPRRHSPHRRSRTSPPRPPSTRSAVGRPLPGRPPCARRS